jgi:hypothetical protein
LIEFSKIVGINQQVRMLTMSTARRKKSNSNAILLAVIALLVAVLIGLVSCGLPAAQDDTTQPPVSTNSEPIGSTAATDPVPSTQPETEPSTEPSTQPPAPEPVAMRVVTDVTVYAEPNEKSAAVGKLALGNRVDVIGTENGWSTITLEGQRCYVSSKVLRGLNEYLVVIDPGHQGKGNFEKEPDGPNSTVMKNKVAAGTTGVSTKIGVSTDAGGFLYAAGYSGGSGVSGRDDPGGS